MWSKLKTIYSSLMLLRSQKRKIRAKPKAQPRKKYRKKRFQCKNIPRVSARQRQIEGWNQEAYSSACGLFIGAGGANGEVVEGAVRKGLGIAHVCDMDIVDPSNLNRQKFTYKDLFKNKAVCLCRNLSKQGFLGSKLVAHPCSFQDLESELDEIAPDFVVCSVDLQIPETRLEVCWTCFLRKIPCIFFAVSTDANWGYVFVQEPGQACWACVLKPELSVPASEQAEKRCPGTPACCDILKALSGQVLYAIDTLVMNRKRDWNYRAISLSKSDFGSSSFVLPRMGCVVCGSKTTEKVKERDAT